MDKVITKRKTKIGLYECLLLYLNISCDKNTKFLFQKSNWEKRPLDHDQLNYAANDSIHLINLRNTLVSHFQNNNKCFNTYKQKFNETKINKILIKKFNEKNEQYGMKYFISNLVICEADSIENLKKLYLDIFRINNNQFDNLLDNKIIFKLCISLPDSKELILQILKENNNQIHENVVDLINEKILKFKNNEKIIISNNKTLNDDKKIQNKRKNEESIVKLTTCKKPVFESCAIMSLEGDLIGYCDTKKMRWYISKNLAEIVTENPPVFKLLFENKSKQNWKSYNTEEGERKNCCVICGKEDNYVRFHVFPLTYRQYIPIEILKTYRTNDFVLLCYNCNITANKLYSENADKILEKNGIPFEFK